MTPLQWGTAALLMAIFVAGISAQGGSKYECPSEGYQKDPQDCTKFYRCIDNGGTKLQAVHFDCAPGTIFSEEASICVHPRDANRPECPDISENLVDGGDGDNGEWNGNSEQSNNNQQNQQRRRSTTATPKPTTAVPVQSSPSTEKPVKPSEPAKIHEERPSDVKQPSPEKLKVIKKGGAQGEF